MITIKRDEKLLSVSISSGVLDTRFLLTWNCNDAIYAELLSQQMNKLMGERLAEIRKEAYEQGYKDGRQKKAKATWFKSWWK